MTSSPDASPRHIDHYTAEFWNDLPAVLSYLARLATGDSHLWWMDHLKRRYADPPRKRALVVGCGNGWVERDLFDRGVAEQFDAFDASEKYLEQAESQRQGRPIRYTRASFSSFRPSGTYDLIVNVAALHHATRLYRLLDVLREALDEDGIFANWDYVGPSRNQYSLRHEALMRAVNESLGERFRTQHPLMPGVRDFRGGDPTEAVHSADIERAFADRFEVLERHPLHGGIAYQLLWNNVAPFRSDDPEARWTLDRLLHLDEAMSVAGLVPELFCYWIGRTRRRATLRARIDRWAREPLREAFARFSLGFYPSDLEAEVLRRWGRWRA